MRLTIAVLLCFCAYLANAQSWLEDYNESVSLYNEASLEQSRESAKKALVAYSESHPNPDENRAAILRQLVLIESELGNSPAALSYAVEEVELLRQLEKADDMYFANALNNVGVLSNIIGKYNAAAIALEEALSISLDFFEEKKVEVAQLKGNLAISLFYLGEKALADTLFSSSVAVMQGAEQPPYDYLNILYEYGVFLSEKGRYEAAYQCFDELEYQYEGAGFDYELAAMKIKSADALENMGRFDEALAKYQEGSALLASIDEQASLDYSIAQGGMARNYQRLGNMKQALDLIEKEYEQWLVEDITNPYPFLTCAINYSNLLLKRQNYEMASQVLEKSKEITARHDIRSGEEFVLLLRNEAELAYRQQELKKAGETLDQAIALIERGIGRSRYYGLYDLKARILLRKSKFTEAVSFAETALELCDERFGKNSLNSAYMKGTLASILGEAGNYQLAQQLITESLPVFEEHLGKSNTDYATATSNLSTVLLLQGKYLTAEKYLTEAVKIKKNSMGSESLDYLTAYENLGLLYLNMARFSDADEILEDVKKQKELLLGDTDLSLARTYANLGNLRKQLAEYPESEELFRKALEITGSRTGRQSMSYAQYSNGLGLVYQKMGNVEAARPLFEKALAIYEETPGKVSADYATVLENMATLYEMEGKYTDAKDLLEEALSIDEEVLGKENPLYSKTLHNLASLYSQEESYDKARQLYQEALQIDEAIFGRNHPSYASTLYNLAVLEQQLGDFDMALSHYQEVVSIRKSLLGARHPDYAYSLYGLASIYQRTGKVEQARSNYQQALDLYLEAINSYFPALSESEKSAFYGKIRPVFESYMDFAVMYVTSQQGSEADRVEMIRQLYDLQLSTKALLLNASSKVRNRILSSNDQQLKRIFKEWIALKEEIAKSLSLSQEELSANNIDIEKLEAEANDLEKELSLKSSEFASEFDREQVTWEDVREALEPNEAAVEIIRIRRNLKNDSTLYATLVLQSSSEAGPSLTIIANGNELENRAFKNYKNSIIYRVTDKKSYQQYWKPIDDLIEDKTANIFVSSDGIYNKVNLATLLDENEQYIVDKYNVRLVSNTRELLQKKGGKGDDGKAAIFGYPQYNVNESTGEMDLSADTVMQRYSFGEDIAELPGTLQEINNIERMLQESGWQYDIYTRNKADEVRVKALKSPKVFHVATHGYFMEDVELDKDSEESIASRSINFNPLMRSGLLLYGAENTLRNENPEISEDGLLTAYEAMNLELDDTELVVMSACETGLGEVRNGEGVYGLQRAFIVAGAENLIMSLWKVDDATTQLLMSEFYKYWLAGSPKSVAFQRAIQKVKDRYPEPYYWGAFVMLGR